MNPIGFKIFSVIADDILMGDEMHSLLTKITCVLLSTGAIVAVLRLILNLYSTPRQKKQAVKDVNEIVASK
jgi:hypothetical protein